MKPRCYGYALYQRDNLHRESTLYVVEQAICKCDTGYQRKTYWYPLLLLPIGYEKQHGSLPIGAMVTSKPSVQGGFTDFLVDGLVPLDFLYGDETRAEFVTTEWFHPDQLDRGKLTGLPYKRKAECRLDNALPMNIFHDFITTPLLDWVVYEE